MKYWKILKRSTIQLTNQTGRENMERFKTLLKLNIKRAYKALFQLVFGAIALIFLVSAIAFYGNEYLYGGITSSAQSAGFKLGVVLNDTSPIADTVVNTVTGMSQVSDTISFEFTDEEKAMDMLIDGEVMAVMVIPEDTVHGIMHGDNTPIQVIFPENSGFEAIIIKEVADAAATLLSSAQAGIYSIYDFYDDHGASSYRKEAINRMNLKYINMAATGMNMFDETTVSATGSTPIMTYYISGALVLFTLLLGMNCYTFIARMSPDATKKLSLSGCPIILQGLSDYIAIALVMVTAIGIVAIPAALIMGIFDISLSTTGIVALLLIIPVFILLASALVYFISQLTLQNMNRIMITFFIALVMCFISGCFIPRVMLPDFLQILSKILPAHYMMNLAGSLLAGSFDGIALAMCLVFTIALFLAGCLASHIRLRKELR